MMDNNKHINLNNLKYYNKELQELYIEPLANKINGLNIENGEGELSVQTPNAPGYEEPINGFPEGRLTKVTGSMSAAIGFNNKISATGSVGLGAYANIQTPYSAGIGYTNITAKGGLSGRGLIGIGNGNAIAANNGSVSIGRSNKIGYIIQLTAEERQAIVDNCIAGWDSTSKTYTPVSEPAEGRTYGGYLKNTIYLKVTKISPFGHITYTVLTEQNLNPSTVYTDPNSIFEYTDKDGVKRQKIALYRLSATKESNTKGFEGAIALGYGNRASSTGAIATGANTWADGFGAFSNGEDNEAHGNHAAVFGYNNTLYGANGFVAGSNHYIVGEGNDDLAVFGRWSQNKDNLLFAVGNGTSHTNRKNAIEVFNDGRMSIQTKPQNETDVVRKLELDNTLSDINTEITGINNNITNVNNNITNVNKRITDLKFTDLASNSRYYADQTDEYSYLRVEQVSKGSIVLLLTKTSDNNGAVVDYTTSIVAVGELLDRLDATIFNKSKCKVDSNYFYLETNKASVAGGGVSTVPKYTFTLYRLI